jgi:Flagellar biosynthesis protein, FliO
MPELLQPYATAIYAALGLAALIILAAILMRLFRGSVRGRKGSRLGISEYYEIDKSRRLVLIRRDDVEHLILIGGGQDVVIEDKIGSPLMTSQVQQMARQAPRPPVFGSRRPTLRTVENAPAAEYDDNGPAQ